MARRWFNPAERPSDLNDLFPLSLGFRESTFFFFLNVGIKRFVREKKHACLTWPIRVLCINGQNSLIMAKPKVMAR